ncbi:MAG: hypothetical protein COA50_16315 [Flavobacteriaceae bacterium]|nr:MAG: hypothetical protein COA50_16315 [Flavobacteriaceae bacterium]
MKILLLDDHSLFSEGLGKILKDHFSNLALDKFTSIKELVQQKTDISSYDLMISDIELPNEDVFELLNSVKLTYPTTPILVITMHNKLSVIKKCKALHIEGYILKDDHDLIIIAVEQLLLGKEFYSKKAKETLNIINKGGKFLTPKEEQIVALIANGINNKEIAKKLFISYNTVKTHRKNIGKKLELSTTGELIRYYFDNYVQ